MKLSINSYRINTGGRLSFRAAAVSDVHERNVDAVIGAVSEIAPDVIFIAGDLIEAKTPEKVAVRYGSDEAYRLLFALSRLAPVYYGLGNHEAFLSKDKKERVRESGAVLLENELERAVCGKNEFLIGAAAPFTDMKFIERFSSAEGYKILLCHEPERYIREFPDADVDLVLSGHAHGGQWRFGGRGVYAPGQGIFPRYTKGFYGKLLVSAGVSNHVPVPRINNRGEVLSLLFE